MTLHRYLLFAGMTYYPGGGWSDFKGSYRTSKEADQAWEDIKDNHDWCQVIDAENPLDPEDV